MGSGSDSDPAQQPDIKVEPTDPELEQAVKRQRAAADRDQPELPEPPQSIQSASSRRVMDVVDVPLFTGKKINTSPAEILSPLSPPGCVISLSFNDYRFRAQWRKEITCQNWIGYLEKKSFSSVFSKDDESWKKSLKLVHANAWEKWKIGVADNLALRLPEGTCEQAPGTISDNVFEQLKPIVSAMRPAVKYGKR